MIQDLDERLITLLKRNSRMSNSQLARTLRVSEGTVRYRIKKLVEEKRILQFTLREGKGGIAALVLVKTTKQGNEVARSLAEMFDEVYELSGDEDIAVFVHAENVDAMNAIVDKIRMMKGVRSTETKVILKTWYHGTAR